MNRARQRSPMQRLKAWWRARPLARLMIRLRLRPPPSTEQQQARALVDAVDAGGLPLNPARVNQIARQLGLEVSAKAPVEQTIARIRAALARSGG